MNFDGESILFDNEGAATTPSLPICERAVDLAQITSIMGDISLGSIARTVKDVLDADARIVTPTDLEEVSIVIDIIWPLTILSLRRNHTKSKEGVGWLPTRIRMPSCHSSLLYILFLFQEAVAPYSIFTSRRKQSY
jgi:hypothetical protein